MRAGTRHWARTLGSESGVAVPMALAVMAATLALALTGATIAIQTNDYTNRDSYNKAAIEAADAGLRTAVYRLNTYQPQPNYCPTVPTSYQVGTNGAPTATLCAPDGPDVSQGLGNGATFTYWISRVMQSGDTCAGPTLSGGSQGIVAQRCITSVGTANGISVRVQERVAAYSSAPAFPTAIFGTKSVTVNNNAVVSSDTAGTHALIGTNGLLTVNNNAVIDGYQLPPGAATQFGMNYVNTGPTTGNSSNYAVPTPIYPYSTQQDTASPYVTPTTSQAGTCSQAEAQSLGWSGTWTQTNCDYEIQRGLQYPGCVSGGLPVKDCDVSAGGVSYDATTHSLSLSNNASLVLQGGYYYFCNLTVANNAVITIAGGQATIFIDHPSDPSANPSCPAGTGNFSLANNATFNAGGSALNAQVLVYGDQAQTPPQNTVWLNNNGATAFALLAPFSNVTDNNNAVFKGAIVGYTVTLANNAAFTYEADTKSFQSSAVPIYYPSYFKQCPSSYGSDPSAGC